MMTPQLQCFIKLSTRHVTEDVRSFTTIADRINARDSLSLHIELAFLMFTKFVQKLTMYTTSETAF